MRRKTIVVLLIGLVLALARFADAQQQTKVTKIAGLEPVPLQPPHVRYLRESSAHSAMSRVRT